MSEDLPEVARETLSVKEVASRSLTEDDPADDIPNARILAVAARSAALACEEVFSMKAMHAEWAAARAALSRELDLERAAATAARTRALDAERAAVQAALSEARVREKFEEQRRRADQLEQYCNELLSSTSWRSTALLRGLGRFMFRGKRPFT